MSQSRPTEEQAILDIIAKAMGDMEVSLVRGFSEGKITTGVIDAGVLDELEPKLKVRVEVFRAVWTRLQRSGDLQRFSDLAGVAKFFAEMREDLEAMIGPICTFYNISRDQFSKQKKQLLDLVVDLYEQHAVLRFIFNQLQKVENNPVKLYYNLEAALATVRRALGEIAGQSQEAEAHDAVKAQVQAAIAEYRRISEGALYYASAPSVQAVAMALDAFDARLQLTSVPKQVMIFPHRQQQAVEELQAEIVQKEATVKRTKSEQASSADFEVFSKTVASYKQQIETLKAADLTNQREFEQWARTARAEVAEANSVLHALGQEMLTYQQGREYAQLPDSSALLSDIARFEQNLSRLPDAYRAAHEAYAAKLATQQAQLISAGVFPDLQPCRDLVAAVKPDVVVACETQVQKTCNSQYTFRTNDLWDSIRDGLVVQLQELKQKLDDYVYHFKENQTFSVKTAKEIERVKQQRLEQTQRLTSNQEELVELARSVADFMRSVDFSQLREKAGMPDQLKRGFQSLAAGLQRKQQELTDRQAQIEQAEKAWAKARRHEERAIPSLEAVSQRYEQLVATKKAEIVAREEAEARRAQEERKRTELIEGWKQGYVTLKAKYISILAEIEQWEREHGKLKEEGEEYKAEALKHFQLAEQAWGREQHQKAHKEMLEAQTNAVLANTVLQGIRAEQQQRRREKEQREQELARQFEKQQQAERARAAAEAAERAKRLAVSVQQPPVSADARSVSPESPSHSSPSGSPRSTDGLLAAEQPVVVSSPPAGSPRRPSSVGSMPLPAQEPNPGFFKRHWRKFAMLGVGLLVAGLVVATIFTAGALAPVVLGVVTGVAMGVTGLSAGAALAVAVTTLAVGAGLVAAGATRAAIAVRDSCMQPGQEAGTDAERQALLSSHPSAEHSDSDDAGVSVAAPRSSTAGMAAVLVPPGLESPKPPVVQSAAPVLLPSPQPSVASLGLLAPSAERDLIIIEVKGWASLQTWPNKVRGAKQSALTACYGLLRSGPERDDPVHRAVFEAMKACKDSQVPDLNLLEARLDQIWHDARAAALHRKVAAV